MQKLPASFKREKIQFWKKEYENLENEIFLVFICESFKMCHTLSLNLLTFVCTELYFY